MTPNGGLYPLSIEVSEKITYAHGIGMGDPWSLDEFLDVTEAMDDAYLSYVRAQIR